jgi:hypothetical protein
MPALPAARVTFVSAIDITLSKSVELSGVSYPPFGCASLPRLVAEAYTGREQVRPRIFTDISHSETDLKTRGMKKYREKPDAFS